MMILLILQCSLLAMAASSANVDFVRNVKLAKPTEMELHFPDSDTPPDNTNQSFVCGGGIVIFTDSLKGEQKEDVLNSTLFAQLAADHKYMRGDITWYKFYFEVMGQIGYTVSSNPTFTKHNERGKTFTMDAAVLDTLNPYVNGEAQGLKSTINAFRALDKKDSHVILFDHYSKNETNGAFQIYPCTYTNGDIEVSLGAFYFDSKLTGDDILFFPYTSSTTSLYTEVQKSTLNMEVYDQVRQTIAEKLGARARTAVENIPIQH